MFIGSLPTPVLAQVAQLLDEVPHDRVFVCCSGAFRLERAVLAKNPTAQVLANDVSLYSCAIGHWLAGGEQQFRFVADLAWLEDVLAGACIERRVAAVGWALELSKYGKGKRNAFKDAHLNHLRENANTYLDVAEAKLRKAFEGVRLAGFVPGDWLDHAERAMAEGATIMTFPPTYKGGYEAQFKWVDANTDWERPAYKLYDPESFPDVLARIHGRGKPYLIAADRLVDEPRPRTHHQAPGKKSVYCYASSGDARYSRKQSLGKPFVYKRLDLNAVTDDSKLTVTRCEGAHAMYVRSVFMKKTIEPAPAMWNYFVWIDDMLAGCICYALDTHGKAITGRDDNIYLLSDLSTTRDGQVSKLIARVATNKRVLDDIAHRFLRPMGYVLTTAFSDHPQSMKYRGVFELLSRKDAQPPQKGFVLNYGSVARTENLDDAFRWWRDKGKPKPPKRAR